MLSESQYELLTATYTATYTKKLSWTFVATFRNNKSVEQVNETEHNKYNIYYSTDALAKGSPSNFASNIKLIQAN